MMGLSLGRVVEDIGLCSEFVRFYRLVEVQNCLRLLFTVALIQVTHSAGITVVRSVLLFGLY